LRQSIYHPHLQAVPSLENLRNTAVGLLPQTNISKHLVNQTIPAVAVPALMGKWRLTATHKIMLSLQILQAGQSLGSKNLDLIFEINEV